MQRGTIGIIPHDLFLISQTEEPKRVIHFHLSMFSDPVKISFIYGWKFANTVYLVPQFTMAFRASRRKIR